MLELAEDEVLVGGGKEMRATGNLLGLGCPNKGVFGINEERAMMTMDNVSPEMQNPKYWDWE